MWEETLQRVKVDSSGLSTEGEEGREALSIEGDPGGLAHQSFEDALFDLSKALED